MKPGFFKNEDLSALSPMHRLCFAGLWLMADKAGRLEDRPRRIKGELFPYESVEVEPLLDDLTAGGFILRYSVEGHPFIQIVNFVKHQRPHKDEPASKIPIPGPECVDSTHDHGDSTQSLGSGAANLPFSREKSVDQVHGERRTENGELGTENGNKNICAEPLSRSTPPVLVFPIVGGGGKTWDLTDKHINDLQSDHPNINALQECRRALAWVKANPSRRKTARGMPAFLARWIGNAVDRRGGDDRRGANGALLAPPRLSKVSSAAIRAIEGAKRR